jgi:glycosyltransferase involved in cell wall biosynthesis
MKILMTLYQIQDYGGIINHVEFLAKGLKELGHEVDFCMLVPKHEIKERFKLIGGDYDKVGTGYSHHQAKGWANLRKYPYLNDRVRQRFRENCSKYDAVLWHIPVPTLNKDNKGVDEWVELYNNGTKNIAIIHDGNLPKLYPHLLLVSKWFHGAVCVHESAFHSAVNLDIPRKMIVNPFDLSNTVTEIDWERREGFAAIQVFKAWKRVDTLIRAIPYIDEYDSNPLRKVTKCIGGAGIEYRYMTSKEKCKPQYFDTDGNKIWDVALANGMEYVGTIPNSHVLEILKDRKLQIDPSWSKKYSEYGAHFNRTTVEAMMMGAVPVATDLGMKNSEIFYGGENFIEVPHTATPKEFAGIINDGMNNRYQWESIRANNISLLKMFEMKTVAQEYIDLIADANRWVTMKIGNPSVGLKNSCDKNLAFFNIPPHFNAHTGTQLSF